MNSLIEERNTGKIIWDKKEPMIASDFVQLDPSLNLNSVQSALRSLLKKNYIEDKRSSSTPLIFSEA